MARQLQTTKVIEFILVEFLGSCPKMAILEEIIVIILRKVT